MSDTKSYTSRITCGFFLCLAWLVSGCKLGQKQPEPSLTNQAWFGTYQKKIGEDFFDDQSLAVRFYRNRTFALYTPQGLASGSWLQPAPQSAVELSPEAGSTLEVPRHWAVQTLTADSAVVLLYQLQNKATILGRLVLYRASTSSKHDPFAPDLHGWRKRPARQESPEQIKARVEGYLGFMESLFEYGQAEELVQMPANWFPQPMLMNYSNGMRMAYSDELEGWNRCFYDSAQAVEGYKLLSGPLRKVRLKTGVDRYERNLDAIHQLQRLLAETKP